MLPAPAGVETLADRLGYALRWVAFAALPLFAMLAAVGNARFAARRSIRPAAPRTGDDRQRPRRRQHDRSNFSCSLAGSLGLAASLSPAQMGVIGAAAIVFVVARLGFWIGYRIDPLYRAFGFSSTAYLNLGLLLGAVWLALAWLEGHAGGEQPGLARISGPISCIADRQPAGVEAGREGSGSAGPNS